MNERDETRPQLGTHPAHPLPWPDTITPAQRLAQFAPKVEQEANCDVTVIYYMPVTGRIIRLRSGPVWEWGTPTLHDCDAYILHGRK